MEILKKVRNYFVYEHGFVKLLAIQQGHLRTFGQPVYVCSPVDVPVNSQRAVCSYQAPTLVFGTVCIG